MVKVTYQKDRPEYFNVLASDGTFRKVVPENTEGAVRRDWVSKDGKSSGTKYELVAQSIEGKITRLGIFDGEYGKNVLIALGDEDGEVVISLNSSQAYAEDFMKKLPNIDSDKPVVLSPYAFMGDDGKNKRGMTVTQDGVKIVGAYSEKNEKTGKWKTLLGMPEPEGDTAKFDTDDWKAHFIKVRKFLLGALENHTLFTKEFTVADVVPLAEGDTGETKPDEIKF